MEADWPRPAIGWVSSALLVLTISKQVWKQWQEGKSEGVSVWLFLGQTAASLGFTIYSVMGNDWVFVVTNALMLASGLLGYFVLLRNCRRTRHGDGPHCPPKASDVRAGASEPGTTTCNKAQNLHHQHLPVKGDQHGTLARERGRAEC